MFSDIYNVALFIQMFSLMSPSKQFSVLSIHHVFIVLFLCTHIASNKLISGEEEAIHAFNFFMGTVLYDASKFKDFNKNEKYGHVKIEVIFYCLLKSSLFLHQSKSDPLTSLMYGQLSKIES